LKPSKLNGNLNQPGKKTKHYGNSASKIETEKVNWTIESCLEQFQIPNWIKNWDLNLETKIETENWI